MGQVRSAVVILGIGNDNQGFRYYRWSLLPERPLTQESLSDIRGLALRYHDQVSHTMTEHDW